MTLEDKLEALGLTSKEAERVAKLIIEAAIVSGNHDVDRVLRSLAVLINRK